MHRRRALVVSVIVLTAVSIAAFVATARDSQADKGTAAESPPERFSPFVMVLVEAVPRTDGPTEVLTYRLEYRSKTDWTMVVIGHENPRPPGASEVGRTLSFDGRRPLIDDRRRTPSRRALPTVEPGNVAVPNRWFVDRDRAHSPDWRRVEPARAEREQIVAGTPIAPDRVVQFEMDGELVSLDGETGMPLQVEATESGLLLMDVINLEFVPTSP